MNRQLLDSQGPILGMTPAQALTAIQTMADHTQKWHNGSSTRNVSSSSNSEGITVIVSKLDSLGRDMKKLKEDVHAIQVGCQTCGGAHLDKECFSDDEKHETKKAEVGEAVATLDIAPNVKLVSQEEKQNLPPKEQDPGSFILSCSIRRLDFNNTLADLESSISVMPFSRDRIPKDHWRERFKDEEDDIDDNEDLEDLKECGEDKANAILGIVLYKLDESWFNGTSEDVDDLEVILDYLEQKSYDGFFNLDDKAYNERKCRLLGLTYGEPPPILIEKVKVSRCFIGPKETYTKVKVLGIDRMPRTRDNVAITRARLMEEIGMDGSTQEEM
ncbi:hypothetical protein Tco_0762281 [Tanacetum coccineum]